MEEWLGLLLVLGGLTALAYWWWLGQPALPRPVPAQAGLPLPPFHEQHSLARAGQGRPAVVYDAPGN